jgi:hypothetical protein
MIGVNGPANTFVAWRYMTKLLSLRQHPGEAETDEVVPD